MVKHHTIRFWDKFWKDEHGRQAVWQTPNLPLTTWIMTTVLVHVITRGRVHSLMETVGFAAIAIWGYLEVRYGVSYFRRLLGVVVLVITIMHKMG